MKKTWIMILLIMLFLVGCNNVEDNTLEESQKVGEISTQNREESNNHTTQDDELIGLNDHECLNLNKTTLNDLLVLNNMKSFSFESNEESDMQLNYEYGTYELGKVRIDGNIFVLSFVVNMDDEFKLILVNELGEAANIYVGSLIEVVNHPEDVGIELTLFKEYLVIVYSVSPWASGSEYMYIYNANMEQIIAESVQGGYNISEDKIEFSKYEYFTDEELKVYEVPEPYNMYRKDFEVIEENDEIKLNKIRDDYTDYGFSSQMM